MDEQDPQPGSVIHLKLHSTDPSASAGFYGTLFGWESEQAQGVDIPAQPPCPPHATIGAPGDGWPIDPPGTLVHILVEDLDETKRAIEASGGRVHVPEVTVDGRGRFAVFEAPGGIVQAIWQPAPGDEASVQRPPDTPPTGAVVHVEMHSTNGPATRRFYRDIFGWAFDELEDTSYHVATMPSPPDGGCFARKDGPFEPPATLVYLLVDAVDAALDRVRKAGGRVIGERYEIEGFGAFGIFEAPGGIVQAVWERTTVPDVPR